MPTPTQQLIELKLGDESLEQFVRSRRATKTAWRHIARDVHEATGVDVTLESLRSWFPDVPTEAAS